MCVVKSKEYRLGRRHEGKGKVKEQDCEYERESQSYY